MSLASEIGTLAPAARLVHSGAFDVWHASARDIPETLAEIGRLRARAFRAAGEGSGTDLDLDAFDRHYVHLFVWDRARAAVIGAYRLGRTDRIVGERSVHGLYTRTLFRYDERLIDSLEPALELGRSFVRPEYQRDYMPLLLLWRGIGRFVVRHPEYRYLFGPVSISARYREASRAVMSTFLETHRQDPARARLATPLHARPATWRAGSAVPSTVEDLDRIVATLEPDGEGMPVLLKQYLKLGATTIGIGVDPAFGHVVDALMAVDLMAVSPVLLRRYLGDDGLAIYTARHHRPELSPAA